MIASGYTDITSGIIHIMKKGEGGFKAKSIMLIEKFDCPISLNECLQEIEYDYELDKTVLVLHRTASEEILYRYDGEHWVIEETEDE